MYETRREKLLTPREFASRVVQHGGYVVIGIAVALGIGMTGYHFIVKLPWIDSFLEAAMILGGMGPLHPPQTAGGKLFAGMYALFSGLFFIGATGLLLAPFLHRMIHKFHLEKKGSTNDEH
jgi:hypothetical protein